jgi:hypothetical protein
MAFFKQSDIAPCGMNRGICKGHLRVKNRCPGCRVVEASKPKTRQFCRILKCDKRQGRYCFQCPIFPCARLKQLDLRYRTKYGMSEIANLEFIRAHGIRKFVKSEACRWLSAEGVFCVHDRKRYPAGKPRAI